MTDQLTRAAIVYLRTRHIVLASLYLFAHISPSLIILHTLQLHAAYVRSDHPPTWDVAFQFLLPTCINIEPTKHSLSALQLDVIRRDVVVVVELLFLDAFLTGRWQAEPALRKLHAADGAPSLSRGFRRGSLRAGKETRGTHSSSCRHETARRSEARV